MDQLTRIRRAAKFRERRRNAFDVADAELRRLIREGLSRVSLGSCSRRGPPVGATGLPDQGRATVQMGQEPACGPPLSAEVALPETRPASIGHGGPADRCIRSSDGLKSLQNEE